MKMEWEKMIWMKLCKMKNKIKIKIPKIKKTIKNNGKVFIICIKSNHITKG